MKKLATWLLLSSSLLLTACGGETNLLASEATIDNTVNAESWFKPVPEYTKKYTQFYNPKYPVAVIAHRGYRDVAPENTMAAFRKAHQIGADMIELDVGLSRDGEVIVMHDDDLDRTTNGKGPVEEKTLAELKELDAGSWFNPLFKGEKIPTLEEVLVFAKDKIAVNVEIKKYSVEKRSQVGIEGKVIKLIEQYGMQDHVLISSFSETAIKRVEQINPNIPTALLIVSDGIFSSQTKKAAEVKADAVNELGTFVNSSEIEKSHKNGIKVNAYTINNPSTMGKLVDKKIDGLITDRPDLALRVLAEKFPTYKALK